VSLDVVCDVSKEGVAFTFSGSKTATLAP
jgi:hypothetical protein